MAKLGDLEALKRLKSEQEKAQKELNKSRSQAAAKKTGPLPSSKKKAIESKKKQIADREAKIKKTEDFLRKNREASAARDKAKKLSEGKKQFEASKARAKATQDKLKTKPNRSSIPQKKVDMIERNRQRAEMRDAAKKNIKKSPAKIMNRTTTAKPLPKVAPTTEAAKQVAKKAGKRGLLRVIPGIGTALTAAELGTAAGSKALDNLRQQQLYNQEVGEGKEAVREGKRVQPEGGFTGSGNLARQVIENQRRGKATRIPESEGLQKSEEYVPKYTEEQLRATDTEPKQTFDVGSFEWMSEKVTGDPYTFARLGREQFSGQAETALKEGTVNPEKVGEQAVVNEQQKRKSEGQGELTQEEATEIKAKAEREFKESGFDAKKAILTTLGVAAMAYAFKEDPSGAINSIASKLDAREQAKLKAAADEANRQFKAEENEKDRLNALEIANLRMKGTLDAAAIRNAGKNALETQAISTKDAQDFVASWAEENEIDIAPDKLMALAEQYRSVYSKNPQAVGADPSAVLGKLAQGRVSRQPTILGFTPFSGDFKFQ